MRSPRQYSAHGRRRKPRRTLLLALALLGAAPATGGEPQPIREPAAIESLLRDQTFYGSYDADGRAWMEYYAPDGRAAFAVDGCVYRGRWWAEGASACFAYPELSGGDPSCFSIARHDEQIEFTPVGEAAPLARAEGVAGNPERLPLDVGECLGM